MIARPSALTHNIVVSLSDPVIGLLPQSELSYTLIVVSLSDPVIGLLSQSELSYTLAVVVQRYDKNTLLTQRDVGSRPTGGIDYGSYWRRRQLITNSKSRFESRNRVAVCRPPTATPTNVVLPCVLPLTVSGLLSEVGILQLVYFSTRIDFCCW